MNGTDPSEDDEESTDEIWDELESFSEDDPTAVDAVENDENDPTTVDALDDSETETTAVDVGDDSETETTAGGASGEPQPNTTASDEFDDPETSPPVDDAYTTTDASEADSHLSNAEATPDADEVFDEMDVSAVDGEALWDELADTEGETGAFERDAPGEPSGVTEPTQPEASSGAAPESAVEADTGTETLVDKRVYCQQCPYFTDPPEVACTHDGTAIVEVIEDGRFRVRNCPVVTETGPDRTILNDDH